MAGKRKAADDEWIEAVHLGREKGRRPYIATFSGVVPAESTVFREFKRKRGGTQPAADDVILQGETERIEYEGRSNRTLEQDNCELGLLFVFFL